MVDLGLTGPTVSRAARLAGTVGAAAGLLVSAALVLVLVTETLFPEFF